jgi:hypothetical protein
MTEEQQAEIERLEAKLKARQNTPGWKRNCEHIEKRIAEIKNGS